MVIKRDKSVLIFLVLTLFSLTFVSSGVYDDCSIYGICKPDGVQITTGSNYSIGVNDSWYLRGLSPQQVANLFTSPYLYNQTIPAINTILGFNYYNSTNLPVQTTQWSNTSTQVYNNNLSRPINITVTTSQVTPLNITGAIANPGNIGLLNLRSSVGTGTAQIPILFWANTNTLVGRFSADGQGNMAFSAGRELYFTANGVLAVPKLGVLTSNNVVIGQDGQYPTDDGSGADLQVYGDARVGNAFITSSSPYNWEATTWTGSNTDTNWGFGVSNPLTDNYYTQARFAGGSGTRGFQIIDHNGNTVPFFINGLGRTMIGNNTVDNNFGELQVTGKASITHTTIIGETTAITPDSCGGSMACSSLDESGCGALSGCVQDYTYSSCDDFDSDPTNCIANSCSTEYMGTCDMTYYTYEDCQAHTGDWGCTTNMGNDCGNYDYDESTCIATPGCNPQYSQYDCGDFDYSESSCIANGCSPQYNPTYYCSDYNYDENGCASANGGNYCTPQYSQSGDNCDTWDGYTEYDCENNGVYSCNMDGDYGDCYGSPIYSYDNVCNGGSWGGSYADDCQGSYGSYYNNDCQGNYFSSCTGSLFSDCSGTYGSGTFSSCSSSPSNDQCSQWGDQGTCESYGSWGAQCTWNTGSTSSGINDDGSGAILQVNGGENIRGGSLKIYSNGIDPIGNIEGQMSVQSGATMFQSYDLDNSVYAPFRIFGNPIKVNEYGGSMLLNGATASGTIPLVVLIDGASLVGETLKDSSGNGFEIGVVAGSPFLQGFNRDTSSGTPIYFAGTEVRFVGGNTYNQNDAQLIINNSGAVKVTTSLSAPNMCYSNGSNCNRTNTSYVPYTGAIGNVNLGNNNLTVGASSTYPMLVVDSANGRVGIGVTPNDANALFVNGTNQLNILKLGYHGDTATMGTYGNGVFALAQLATPIIRDQGAGMGFYTYSTANNISFCPNNNCNIRMTGTGNLGIGTASPITTLDVNGSINIPTTTATGGIIYQNTTRLIHSAGTMNFFAGQLAGNLTTTGSYNTGIGYGVMTKVSSGIENTGIGYFALTALTSGSYNTAIGINTLHSVTTGDGSTALGRNAMGSLTTGGQSTAVGNYALSNEQDGSSNTVVGASAMQNARSSNYNTCIGFQCLYKTTTAGGNVGIGYDSLYNLTTGGYNVGIGYRTGIGDYVTTNQSSTVDTNMVFIGFQASRDGSIPQSTVLTNGVAIGKNAKVGASNTIVLGGTGADAVNVSINQISSPNARFTINGTMNVSGLSTFASNITAPNICYSNGTGCLVNTTNLSYVPYSGATGNVSLGANNLIINSSNNAYIARGSSASETWYGVYNKGGNMAQGIGSFDNSALGSNMQFASTYLTLAFGDTLNMQLHSNDASFWQPAYFYSQLGDIGSNTPLAVYNSGWNNDELFKIVDTVDESYNYYSNAYFGITNTHINDNTKAYFGSSDDASINYDGTNLVINPKEVGAGKVQINGDLNATGNVVVGGNFSAKRPYWNGYDNSTQNFLNTANTQIMNISNNNDYDSYYISVEGSSNLTFAMTGDYLCIVSPEFTNTATTAQIAFWYEKWNGTGWTQARWSNSRYSISNGQYLAPAIPFQFDIDTPNTEKVRFMWYSTSTNSKIESISGLTAPTRPSVPGVILNCQKVSEIT